jgi:hypothetical protein
MAREPTKEIVTRLLEGVHDPKIARDLCRGRCHLRLAALQQP